jgi:hypothetical protein
MRRPCKLSTRGSVNSWSKISKDQRIDPLIRPQAVVGEVLLVKVRAIRPLRPTLSKHSQVINQHKEVPIIVEKMTLPEVTMMVMLI